MDVSVIPINEDEILEGYKPFTLAHRFDENEVPRFLTKLGYPSLALPGILTFRILLFAGYRNRKSGIVELLFVPNRDLAISYKPEDAMEAVGGPIVTLGFKRIIHGIFLAEQQLGSARIFHGIGVEYIHEIIESIPH